MVIKQGDIFWIDLDQPSGSGPGYSHPFVVVQNNIFNKSQIGTVIVCAITSNLKQAKSPGNILLFPGESDLSKQSVVNISQIYTVDKKDLSEKIGTLSPERVQEMLDSMDLILKSRDIQHA